MILHAKFDLFATVIGCTCVHPCPNTGSAPGSWWLRGGCVARGDG